MKDGCIFQNRREKLVGRVAFAYMFLYISLVSGLSASEFALFRYHTSPDLRNTPLYTCERLRVRRQIMLLY